MNNKRNKKKDNKKSKEKSKVSESPSLNNLQKRKFRASKKPYLLNSCGRSRVFEGVVREYAYETPKVHRKKEVGSRFIHLETSRKKIDNRPLSLRSGVAKN